MRILSAVVGVALLCWWAAASAADAVDPLEDGTFPFFVEAESGESPEPEATEADPTELELIEPDPADPEPVPQEAADSEVTAAEPVSPTVPSAGSAISQSVVAEPAAEENAIVEPAADHPVVSETAIAEPSIEESAVPEFTPDDNATAQPFAPATTAPRSLVGESPARSPAAWTAPLPRRPAMPPVPRRTVSAEKLIQERAAREAEARIRRLETRNAFGISAQRPTTYSDGYFNHLVPSQLRRGTWQNPSSRQW